jgi:hypothetical protein
MWNRREEGAVEVSGGKEEGRHLRGNGPCCNDIQPAASPYVERGKRRRVLQTKGIGKQAEKA